VIFAASAPRDASAWPAPPPAAVTGPSFYADDLDGRFEFGLDVMIAGLEMRARR
jgi:hypothetical protein